jgi:hypothetical protein
MKHENGCGTLSSKQANRAPDLPVVLCNVSADLLSEFSLRLRTGIFKIDISLAEASREIAVMKSFACGLCPVNVAVR